MDSNIFSDIMTDNQKLRLAELKNILSKARKVFLVRGENYEDDESFKRYLKEIDSQSNIEFMDLERNVNLSKKDAIFPLYTDVQKYLQLVKGLVQAGISLFQIFPPAIYYFPFLIQKRGFIIPPPSSAMTNFQLPFLATIDTVNVCNLDCATCIKPDWAESSDRMSFELFQKILDKLQIIGIRQVELYNFTEPFLNPEIYKFMAEVKKRGLTLGISSNLSLPHIPKLKECVDRPFDRR